MCEGIMDCRECVMKQVRGLVICTAALIVIVAAGCGKSADDLYSEGRRLMMEKETFESGIETLLRFEKKYPDDPRAPEVVLAIATGYQGAELYDEAAEAFRRLIANYPGTDEAYKGMFLLGYMYYDSMNDTAKAKYMFETFISTYPDSELTVSAKVLLDNIGKPVEEWSIVRELNTGITQ